MRFKLLSDLHLEFYGDGKVWKPEPTKHDKDTVLLLAGDIHVGRKALPWIKEMCERFYDVVYILGNHEFYNNEWQDIKNYWRDVYKYMPNNFTFLDDDVVFIDDVRIIGGTLWTKCTDPHKIWRAKVVMTDYRIIDVKNNDNMIRRLTVHDTNNAHDKTVKYIKTVLETPWNGKTIVMTHHLPHPVCVAERFKNDGLTAFFMTDLDYLIKGFNIDYWIHGHTHDTVNVEIHNTKILCNPMGYHGIEFNKEFQEDLTFEC